MSGKKSQPARRTRRPAAADALAANAPLSETAALLALAAPPSAAPPLRVREQLLARIRAAQAPGLMPPAAAEPGWRFESANAGEGWRAASFPGVRLKTLSVDEARDVA